MRLGVWVGILAAVTGVTLAAADVARLVQVCTAGGDRACMKLLDLARTHEDPEVRKAAVEGLPGQAYFIAVAKESGYEDSRRWAIEKVTDQGALASLARDPGPVAKLAVMRLTNQTVLANVANEATEDDAAVAAVGRLTSQPLLAILARRGPTLSVRRAAIARLTADDLLIEFARDDSDSSVRLAALGRIGDRNVAYELAMTEKDPAVRDAMLEQLRTADEIGAARQIRDSGPGDRFTLKGFLAGAGPVSGASDSTAVLLFEEGADQKRPDIAELPDGSVVRFRGEVSLNGFVFRGARPGFVSFVVLHRDGLVYLGGAGSVTGRDGKTLPLPPPAP
jgi:hypothetical protein